MVGYCDGNKYDPRGNRSQKNFVTYATRLGYARDLAAQAERQAGSSASTSRKLEALIKLKRAMDASGLICLSGCSRTMVEPPQQPQCLTVRTLDEKKLEKLFSDLNSRLDNLATKTSVSELCEKVETLLEKHDDVLGQLSTHSQQIGKLEEKNCRLNKEVKVLKEKVNEQDQCSRRYIVILTGLPYTDKESPTELNGAVLEIINKITGNGIPLNSRDFDAIYRNRRNINKNRPPTTTIKFLRCSDKDAMFTKRARTTLKQLYSHIKFHHGMSPGSIDIRRKLSEYDSVKFVRYEGASRFFTVCLSSGNGGPDIFLNRIRNVQHLNTELDILNSR